VTKADQKQLIRDYKTTPRPMGVYRVRNVPMRKSLVASSADLASMLNRLRFQLQNGPHKDSALQRDWNELGPTGFAFEVLDYLQPKDEPTYDPREDLSVLKELWTEKLVASGETVY
jgi:hypothetical protein